MPQSEPQATPSRRTFLRGTAVAGGIALGIPTSANAGQLLQWVVSPQIDAIEEYQAQIVYVAGSDGGEAEQIPEESDPGNLPDQDPEDIEVSECEIDDPWPSERTTTYDVYLIDRLADQPSSYDVTVAADEDGESLESGGYYIVQQVAECNEDYIALQLEPVPEDEPPDFEADRADDPGNGGGNGTAAEEGTPGDGDAIETPGFGAIGALVAVAVGAGIRALQRRGEG